MRVCKWDGTQKAFYCEWNLHKFYDNQREAQRARETLKQFKTMKSIANYALAY